MAVVFFLARAAAEALAAVLDDMAAATSLVFLSGRRIVGVVRDAGRGIVRIVVFADVC